MTSRKMRIHLIFLLITISSFSHAQTSLDSFTDQQLFKKIESLDSSLFAIFYYCNPGKTDKFFAEDLEFYHDKGGLTKGRQTLMDMLSKSYCNGPVEWQTRRELVKGSMQICKIKDFGVLQTGDHLFYETWSKTKKEKLVGKAKFTILWQYKDGEFKITRAFSYDHQPAGDSK